MVLHRSYKRLRYAGETMTRCDRSGSTLSIKYVSKTYSRRNGYILQTPLSRMCAIRVGTETHTHLILFSCTLYLCASTVFALSNQSLVIVILCSEKTCCLLNFQGYNLYPFIQQYCLLPSSHQHKMYACWRRSCPHEGASLLIVFANKKNGGAPGCSPTLLE